MGEVNVNGVKYLNFEDERPESLVSAISRIYYIFYEVDLQKDSFIKFHASRLVSAYTDRFTGAHECLQGLSRVMFVPEHQDMVAAFYDSASWPEFLREKDTVYLDAIGIQSGWVRTNLIVAARGEDQVPTHVIVAIQGVNEQKNKENEQAKQLARQLEEIIALNTQMGDTQSRLETQMEEIKALNAQLEDNQAELEASAAEQEAQLEEITALNTQLEDNQAELEAAAEEQRAQLEEINTLNGEMVLILQSLADIYYSMHLINLEDDTVIPYKAQDEIKDIVNHTHGAVQMMADVISAVATEEYRAGALMFTDLTTLRERMKDTRIITAEFIGTRIGWSQASFVTVKADKDGRPAEVMFLTRSIDAEKRREESLIRASYTDVLTGLPNRRAYEAVFDTEDASAGDLVYIAFDVNGLKTVNDCLGHAAGDELIVAAADCIRNSFGKYGKVFRTGGDEFAAVLHIGADELEKARAEFERSAAGWSGVLVNRLGIAAGYVSAVQDSGCGDLHAISVLADKRMYQSKSEYYRQCGIDRRKR